MKPLLSIAIATKNRVQYCIQAIETILNYKYDNFELIIQDNTDNIELEEYIKNNFSDSRLVYRYTPPPFSSIDNFNAVLELCKGKYVCLLGDDDGVTENLFKIVEWADKNNVDSICPTEFVHYIWPNNTTNGKMVVPYSTHTVWENKPMDNLQDLIEDGVVQYMKFNLPKLYHGVIKKSCLDEMKSKNGYYLGGLSPDIYACIALSSIVKKHIVVDSPMTIAGACPKSTTIDNTTGKHSGKIEDAPHFRSRENYVWDSGVPRFYSVETIWAESAIKAIKEFNIHVDLTRLNLTKILASAVNTTPSYEELFKEETFKITNRKENMITLNSYKLSLFVETYTKKIINRIPRKYFFKHYRFTDVQNIKEAEKIANSILNKTTVLNNLQLYRKDLRKI
jgi:glycosyltransferase involved in cell wall biosynthesis